MVKEFDSKVFVVVDCIINEGKDRIMLYIWYILNIDNEVKDIVIFVYDIINLYKIWFFFLYVYMYVIYRYISLCGGLI